VQDSITVNRKYNFSAGPAVMPVPVLEKVQSELLALDGVGSSILEISHRSDAFDLILANCRKRLTKLLNIPDTHEILFLQGGSRLQFAMIPMNITVPDQAPTYIVTGTWGKKAFQEAEILANATCPWDGAAHNYSTIPDLSKLEIKSESSYLYIVSNETIQGVQFPTLPNVSTCPLIVDASSDALSRPISWENVGIYYACAQKNAGIAGLTIVIMDKQLLPRSADDLPGYLNYNNHVQEDSRYNTPPVFGIYVLDLICQWIEEEFGNLESLGQHNQKKSKLLYDVIDASDFYIGHADQNCRSNMNVTFRLANEQLESQFKSFAANADLVELAGHRSVGGFRASIYNAMPMAGVEQLANVMKDFASRH
jgi:phosphoserine aminotransferase